MNMEDISSGFQDASDVANAGAKLSKNLPGMVGQKGGDSGNCFDSNFIVVFATDNG